MRYKGKKSGEPLSVPTKLTKHDSLFTEVKSNQTSTDEVTEEEAQFQSSKRRKLLSADWAKKLLQERMNTSITNSAQIKVTPELYSDTLPQSTSDISHDEEVEAQVTNHDTLNLDGSNFDVERSNSDGEEKNIVTPANSDQSNLTLGEKKKFFMEKENSCFKQRFRTFKVTFK